MKFNRLVSATSVIFVTSLLLTVALYWQAVQVFNGGENKRSPPSPFRSGVLTLDFELNDVLVFLHIQKTGGTTFGRHLVSNLIHDPPCECKTTNKKCDCYTKNGKIWLFSLYSTGKPCGFHPDWTTLKPCVNHAMNELEGIVRKRSFHYVTMLREPVARYISEWQHVQRGAIYKPRLVCNDREATSMEVPLCYNSRTWHGVSLREFLGCEYNLAHNRQSRMLANLSMIGCYNNFGQTNSSRDKIMLESAKTNLLHMDYFGLTEFQEYSQLLFEHTFNMQFKENFGMVKNRNPNDVNISKQEVIAIQRRNELDIELYHFAKEIFLQRVQRIK